MRPSTRALKMGAGSSSPKLFAEEPLRPPSRGAKALHTALFAFDEAKLAAALKAGADVDELVEAPADARYLVFREGGPPSSAGGVPVPLERFAMPAMGSLLAAACGALLLADTQPGALTVPPASIARVAALLVAAGSSPNAPTQYSVTPAGTLSPLAGPPVSVLRGFIAHSPTPTRPARAAYLQATYLALLSARGLCCVTAADVLCWAEAGATEVVAALGSRYGDVLLSLEGRMEEEAPTGGDTPRPPPTLIPPLLVVIDSALARPVQWMLEAGADANACFEGRSALAHASGAWERAPGTAASKRAARAIVEVLLTHGADARAAGADGRTALHAFASAECALDMPTRLACAARLVRAGADPTAADRKGLTPIGTAPPRLALVLTQEWAWMRRRTLVRAWAGGRRGSSGRPSSAVAEVAAK